MTFSLLMVDENDNHDDTDDSDDDSDGEIDGAMAMMMTKRISPVQLPASLQNI